MSDQPVTDEYAGGPDMEGVNRHDPEDCERCFALLNDVCGFHQGFDEGFGAALRLMREAVEDPETVHFAIADRDRLRRIRQEQTVAEEADRG